MVNAGIIDKIKSYRLSSFLIGVLLILGIFLPSSIHGQFPNSIMYANFSILFVILFTMLLNIRLVPKYSLFFGIAINAILWLYTLMAYNSGVANFHYGTNMEYLNLALLLLIPIKQVKITPFVRKSFFAISLICIVTSCLIITKNSTVGNIIINDYSAEYANLSLFMLMAGKPVFTFASHSLAGFYFYLFFYLNFKTYLHENKRMHLMFAICFAVLLWFMKSNTGCIYGVISMVQLLYYFGRKRILVFCGILALICVLIMVFQGTVGNMVGLIGHVLSNSNDGFVGRYTSSGTLGYNFLYLSQHPFTGIGYWLPDFVFAGDSGVIENLLRGSVFLFCAFYFGLLYYFKFNINSRKIAYFLFAMYFVFELGNANFDYFRTLYLLPFVMVYLNGVQENKVVKLDHRSFDTRFECVNRTDDCSALEKVTRSA